MLSPSTLYSLNYCICVIGILFFIFKEFFFGYKPIENNDLKQNFNYENAVKKYGKK